MSAGPDVPGDDLEKLAERLRVERGDAEAIRAQLLHHGAPLIREVIEDGFASTGFSSEELFRPGYLGLLNAVYNCELAHGKAFRDYAEGLIKGEIRSHIRECVQPRRMPGWMRDLNRQIESAEARLLRETGQLPSLERLAEAVNITEEGLTEIFKAREALSYVSLDAGQRENDPAPQLELDRIRGKHPSGFPIEDRIKLASALERLAELQQYLLHSLFTGEE